MSVKRCLVVEQGAVAGDYFNLQFAQSQHEVKKLLRALPMMTRMDEPRRFELLPRNPLEEHFYYAFRAPHAAFTLVATLVGDAPARPLAELFAPIRAFLAEEDPGAGGNRYARVTRFLREHFAALESQRAEEEKIDVLERSLERVKERTQESFQKIISRGRDLGELSSEASALSLEACSFSRGAGELRRVLDRKRGRQRWLLLFALLCAFLVVYLVFV